MNLPFIPKTVDGVLKVFNKAISDLEVVAQTQREAAIQRDLKAAALQVEAGQARYEANRAAETVKKLKELIG